MECKSKLDESPPCVWACPAYKTISNYNPDANTKGWVGAVQVFNNIRGLTMLRQVGDKSRLAVQQGRQIHMQK